MPFQPLTFRSISATPIVLKLKRPVIARIATITEWPLILIDLHTEEGIVGRSYLEPYTTKTMKYLVPALHDFGELFKGRKLVPLTLYELARKSLHFVGYQGQSMIAVSGLDMAAWDALAKAADMPLCVLLGGEIGPVRAYNSNGLWLQEPRIVAEQATELRDEGAFTGLKLRLGREQLDDIKTLEAVRKAVGDDMHLMVDFNQGLHLGEALQRCYAIDDFGLDWLEEPIVYDNLDGRDDIKTLEAVRKAVGDDMHLSGNAHTVLCVLSVFFCFQHGTSLRAMEGTPSNETLFWNNFVKHHGGTHSRGPNYPLGLGGGIFVWRPPMTCGAIRQIA